MKQQFIDALKNGQVPFSENEEALGKLPDDMFEPFNSDSVGQLEQHQHRWNENYFKEKIIDLDCNFSKELVQHLIQVKKHFQQKQNQSNHVQSAVDTSQNLTSSRVGEKPSKPVISKPQVVEKTEKFAILDLSNFKPNESLEGFLKAGDNSKIRSYLMSMLNNRRLSLDELFKSIWYVNEHKPEVFEAEEETAFVEAINNTESAWNIEYFNLQQVYLNKNFSLARLLHLANVRETLMKRGDINFRQINVERKSKEQAQPKFEQKSQQNMENMQSESSSSTNSRSQPHQNTPHTPNPSEQKNDFVKVALIVGGAVLALAGILLVVLK